MGKLRVRLNIKGNRWKKGQSSSSNPTASKFREAAKSNFFQENLGDSNLTQDAVEKHDKFSAKRVEEEMEEEMEDEELETLSRKTAKTFDTFASDWTSCSNKSFSKLLMNFRSDSVIHKEMLAILAAVAEVIKENGGRETSTEYFAALMTALNSEENDDSAVLSIMHLLSMGMKTVPEVVLQKKFSESSKIFIDVLVKFAQTENVSILRPVLGCIALLLRAQETAVWNNSSTINILDTVLSFITFSKPKIRKAAQHGVISIVKLSNITNLGLAHIAKHCIRLINSIAEGGATTTLHTLTLLKDIAHKFPKTELKVCIESILKVMTLNNVLLSSCSMQALHGILSARPPASSLSAPHNAKLVTALFDYQPPQSDGQRTQAWLTVMKEGYVNLAKNNLGLCMANVTKFITISTELYMSEKKDILSAVTHTVEVILSECIAPASESSHLAKFKPYISKVVAVLQTRLGYQYFAAWAHVIHLMTGLFKACGATCSRTVLPIVRILSGLRDSYQFTYTKEVDNAVGSAIRTVGPELVLEAIPFQVTGTDKEKDFKRSWLLPVLKDNIKASSIKFFTEFFLPMATICRNTSEKMKVANDQVGALSYDLLQSQIWALLPSICSQPSDITASFPVIAKALGGVLSNRKDLRQTVMASLRKLITYAIESDLVEDKETMGKYAKNYLPIIFNIYTTQAKGSDEEGLRLASYETIKVYLKVTDEALQHELFTKAFNKLTEENQDKFMKESVLDLLRALICYQTKEQVELLYEYITKHINEDDDHNQQKKYYRILEELCTNDSEVTQKFVSDNIDKIKTLLLASLSKAAPSSKGARLKCLLELLGKCDDPESLINSIIPEAVLCVKDVNAKCREVAYKLLEVMSDMKDLQEYVEMIMAGLSGNKGMMSSALLALAAVIHHVKAQLPEPLEEQLLYNVGLLALSDSREVVSTAMSFMKVYIQAYDRDKVAKYVPKALKIFSNMNEDCKRHCRTKIRDILGRFVRWYGSEALLRVAPSNDEVLKVRIRNLGRIHNRKKKQREEEKQQRLEGKGDLTFVLKGPSNSIEDILAESDSDIDYLDDEEGKSTKKLKKKSWITEGSEEIVDFMDTATNKKITATKPGAAGEASTSQKILDLSKAFKQTCDGRLIIAEESDSDDSSEGKRKKSFIPGLDSDSDIDDYEPSETDENPEPSTSRKRAMSMSTAGTSGPSSKYQAGGSGIHRPTGKFVAKKGRAGEVYKSKKAGGDMKRKGLPEPFAYVPLQRDALNKRKKMKHAGQFKNLVRGAKKGAQAGMKNKPRKKK